MIYCEKCREVNDWPKSLVTLPVEADAIVVCEVCTKIVEFAYQVPEKQIELPKKDAYALLGMIGSGHGVEETLDFFHRKVNKLS